MDYSIAVLLAFEKIAVIAELTCYKLPQSLIESIFPKALIQSVLAKVRALSIHHSLAKLALEDFFIIEPHHSKS